MTRKVSAYKLRTNLGEVLNEVYYKNVEVIVERKGKPLARITRPEKPREFKRSNKPLFKLAGLISKEAISDLEKGVKDVRKRTGKRISTVKSSLK